MCMNNNFPVNDRGAAISMIGAMLVLGFTDNFIVFIAEVVSLWQFQIISNNCTTLNSLYCLFLENYNMAKKKLGRSISKFATNNSYDFLFLVVSIYSNGSGFGWLVYFTYF